MSDRHSSTEDLIARLRADMPPVPDAEDLRRTKLHVLDRRLAGRASTGRGWRLAGSVAVAAAVVLAAALAFTQGPQSAAFARDKAARALALQVPGRVLHLEMTMTARGTSGDGGPEKHDTQRWSYWLDAEGKRSRSEFVNVADGSLDQISVRVGDREMTLLTNARYPKQYLFDQDDIPQPASATPMDDMLGMMPEAIADGSAKVTGTRTIDGDEYWVVVRESAEGDVVETVTMRRSDYRLKTWERTVDSGTAGKTTKAATFDVVEQVDPAAMAPDFFSFDAVEAAVKPGVPLEK